MNACTAVTRALTSYFTSNKKNLFWMCDNCAELFENSLFRSLSSQADEKSPLNALASAIAELRTEIKQLNSKPIIHSSPTTNTHWPVIDQRRGIKRRVIESNVRATETCCVGSKKPQENDVSVPICKNEEDRRFWLYLSKIRPDVTVETVRAMAKANLKMENDPAVLKLVPKGRDIETLSFVSFKIGLDPSLKQQALDPGTWPEGVLFREFENYGTSKFRPLLKSNRATTPLLRPETTASPVTPVMDLN